MNEDLDGKMNDSMANLYNIFNSGSGLVSPIIGGALYDEFGYNSTMNICMFALYGFTLIYILFNSGGVKVFDNFKYNKDRLEELR